MNKGKRLLEKSYHIPLEMFDRAFGAFQKKYVFPQNILITVILLAIAGDFIYAAIKKPDQTLVYLLIVICFALVLVRWYRTFKLRRSVHEALAEIEQDKYTLTVYEEALTIKTEDRKPEPAAEKEQEQTQPDETADDTAKEGFQEIFPESAAENAEPITATELHLDRYLKITEYDDFFMVYLVKQNFWVIPKKDFSADEIKTMQQVFFQKS